MYLEKIEYNYVECMNTLEYSSIDIENICMCMHGHYEVTISMAYLTKQHAIMMF